LRCFSSSVLPSLDFPLPPLGGIFWYILPSPGFFAELASVRTFFPSFLFLFFYVRPGSWRFVALRCVGLLLLPSHLQFHPSMAFCCFGHHRSPPGRGRSLLSRTRPFFFYTGTYTTFLRRSSLIFNNSGLLADFSPCRSIL